MEIVQEDDTKTRQRSRTRARSRAAAEDDVEPLLLSEDDGGLLHDDDDDLILRLDQSNGVSSWHCLCTAATVDFQASWAVLSFCSCWNTITLLLLLSPKIYLLDLPKYT